MGYYMSQMESVFYIPCERAPEALAALKLYAEIEARKMPRGAMYAWVRPEFTEAPTLAKALEYWRWETEADEKGNIVGISFAGERLGDDKVLFEAIAPYVKRGSYIQMLGSDDYIWRWTFDGRRFRERECRVVVAPERHPGNRGKRRS